MKSLSWHISRNHNGDGSYPFTIEQIQEILKILAKAIELGILPCQEYTQGQRARIKLATTTTEFNKIFAEVRKNE